MGDALAVVLLKRKQFRAADFRENHPGGSLGERLKVNVSEVMLTGEDIPSVQIDTAVSTAVTVLNRVSIGAVLIIDENRKVRGIITDGDVRRAVAEANDLAAVRVDEFMTASPVSIRHTMQAVDALSIMQQHEITVLPIVSADEEWIGILHLHDLLGKGEFRFLV